MFTLYTENKLSEHFGSQCDAKLGSSNLAKHCISILFNLAHQTAFWLSCNGSFLCAFPVLSSYLELYVNAQASWDVIKLPKVQYHVTKPLPFKYGAVSKRHLKNTYIIAIWAERCSQNLT